MRPAEHVRRRLAELLLQRAEKRVKEIEEQAARLLERVAHLVVDERREHDRADALVATGLVDLRGRFARLVNGGDEWQSDRPEFHAVELRQQAVSHRLGSDAGLVGHEEDGSSLLHGG